MGLTIYLQDSKGNVFETITDESNLLHNILPASADSRFLTISRIDWYGDTIFNRMQMADVIQDLKRLDSVNFSPAEKDMVFEIISLAKTGIERPHFYLKFCGD